MLGAWDHFPCNLADNFSQCASTAARVNWRAFETSQYAGSAMLAG
jgi:hypothetical protein